MILSRRTRPRHPVPAPPRDEADDGSATPALDRGLAVVELLAARRAPLRAIDIADALGIPKGSLGRILRNLVARGWLERDERTMTVALTTRLLAMGGTALGEKNLTEEALPHMRELRDLSGETIQLNVLHGETGVVLEVVPSRHPVRLMIDPGTLFAPHAAAPGKVLLAGLPEPECEALLDRLPLPRLTYRTITDRGDLRQELERVRDQGHALDREECLDGVRCVAAPIRDRTGTCIAALTVTGPSVRMRIDRFSDLIAATITQADRITQRLGYHRIAAG